MEAIKFDLGKEPETKKSLVGTVVNVQGTLTYTKSLIGSEDKTIIESKPEVIQLGGFGGLPTGIPGAPAATEQQVAISAAEEVAKQEIAAALIKLDAVRKANS